MIRIDYAKLDGLVPAVVQDARTGQVLMVGFMDRAAVKKTIATGNVWFWSRTKGRLWMKGESSGHVQKVKKILTDCDNDTLLITVDSKGPVCHTGKRSCFFKPIPLRKKASLSP